MSEGKFLAGLSPETPAADAAAAILADRLGAVADALPAVVLNPVGDAAAVHQLRVATRRASAALKAVRPCVRRRAFPRLARALRELRRAAGAARDWDVQVARLSSDVGSRGDRMLLAGYALGRRQAASGPLADAAAEWQPHLLRWAERPERLLTRRSKRGRETLADLAAAAVPGLLVKFELASTAPTPDLHVVRVAAKRVRYALELFPAPDTRELYDSMEELQAVLGRANDARVGAEKLAALRDALPHLPPADSEAGEAALAAYADELRTAGEAALAEYEAWREKWTAMRAGA